MSAWMWVTLASTRSGTDGWGVTFPALVKAFEDADGKPGHLPVYVDHDRAKAPVGFLVGWVADPQSQTIRGVLQVRDDSTILRVAHRELLDVSLEFMAKRAHRDEIGHTIVDEMEMYNIALVHDGADPLATIHEVILS
ncbi:MAG: hypothetical protein ABSF61_10770 [Anaerolineales bacterium]|jgi:hypothetical protein